MRQGSRRSASGVKEKCVGGQGEVRQNLVKTHHILNLVRNLYSKFSPKEKKTQCGPEAADLLVVCISV